MHRTPSLPARALLGAALAGLVAGTAGCARFTSSQGVDNTWRGRPAPAFTDGVSTEADVLAALGPPSQVIALHRGTAFYYLREYGEGNVTILLVYNTSRKAVNYDRAVFFFDENGLLTAHAYSAEQAPRP